MMRFRIAPEIAEHYAIGVIFQNRTLAPEALSVVRHGE
jgi:hypothetical protein